jgi:hypothetical protein
MAFFHKPTSRRNFLIKAAVEEKEDSSPNQLQEPANICQHLPMPMDPMDPMGS